MSWWKRALDKASEQAETPRYLSSLGTPQPKIEDPKDSGMKTYKVSGDRLVMIEAKPGEIIPCEDPQNAVIVPPKDPEPDLSTKPKDHWEFQAGLACKNKHLIRISPYQSTEEMLKEAPLICRTCGSVVVYAIYKNWKTSRWQNLASYNLKPYWGWNAIFEHWNGWKFVRFLDSPKSRRKK